MKAGGGHAKGAAFERYVARRLSLWLSRGRRDDLIWRSATSGGRATFQLRQGIVNQAQAGDLSAIAPRGYELCERCLFEAKFYQDLNFAGLVTSRTGFLAEFWRITQAAARRLDRIPVLIAKQNRMPAILLCPWGCSVFGGKPYVTLHSLLADIYSFEEVTEVPHFGPAIRRPRNAEPEKPIEQPPIRRPREPAPPATKPLIKRPRDPEDKAAE